MTTSAAIREINGNILEMVLNAGPMVKLVLILLLFLSVFSWAIILHKYRLFKRIDNESERFLSLFKKESQNIPFIYKTSSRYVYTPFAKLYKAAYEEYGRLRKYKSLSNPSVTPDVKENILRVLRRTTLFEINNMESTLPFLATTGNTAPFIGLFGTVWGIMNSFRGIGVQGSASLAVVAPGISEALIATAMGLAAAIPAVVAYNHFTTKINNIISKTEAFSEEIIWTITSSIDKQEALKSTIRKA